MKKPKDKVIQIAAIPCGSDNEYYNSVGLYLLTKNGRVFLLDGEDRKWEEVDLPKL